jgi:putative SOS response-associated peptidase YedK
MCCSRDGFFGQLQLRIGFSHLDRIPLIVGPTDYDTWLSAVPPPVHLLRPYSASAMTAYEVSTKLNKAGYGAPDILDLTILRASM